VCSVTLKLDGHFVLYAKTKMSRLYQKKINILSQQYVSCLMQCEAEGKKYYIFLLPVYNSRYQKHHCLCLLLLNYINIISEYILFLLQINITYVL